MKNLLQFLKALLMSFYLGFSFGFVLFKFLGWFIYPVFPIDKINYLSCVGLIVFIAIFSNHAKKSLKPEFYKDSEFDVVLTKIISPWIVLFLGFLFTVIISLLNG